MTKAVAGDILVVKENVYVYLGQYTYHEVTGHLYMFLNTEMNFGPDIALRSNGKFVDYVESYKERMLMPSVGYACFTKHKKNYTGNIGHVDLNSLSDEFKALAKKPFGIYTKVGDFS